MKRQIWHGKRNLQPTAQCIVNRLDQGLQTTVREEILSLMKK